VRILKGISTISLLAAATLTAHGAPTLGVANMNALEGLAPITALGNTDAGKAALAPPLGTSRAARPISRSCCRFPISSSRRSATPSSPALPMSWSDGLGNKLGDAYQNTIMADCKTSIFTASCRQSPA
jgi:hypothetical protein